MGKLIKIPFAVRTLGDSTGAGNAAVTYTATTLKDTRRSAGVLTAWKVDELIGVFVTANAKTAVVVSNTIDMVTVASWTGGTPAANSAYVFGGAGISGGSTRIKVPSGIAWFHGLSLDYDATAPATTDITVVANDPTTPGITPITLYTKANSVTDVPFIQPRIPCVDTNGSVIAVPTTPFGGWFENAIVFGGVTVTLAQCNDLAVAVQGVVVFEVA